MPGYSGRFSLPMSTATAPRPKTRKKTLLPQEEAHIVYKDPARQAQMAGLRYACSSTLMASRSSAARGNRRREAQAGRTRPAPAAALAAGRSRAIVRRAQDRGGRS